MPFPQTPSPLANILTAKTYNAAWFSGSTKELQITAAIAAAVTDGALYVYVPANMLPYNASAVTFNTAVKMIREGGDQAVYDVKAYGAAGDGVTDDTAAFQATVNNASDYSTILYPSTGALAYKQTGAVTLTNRNGLTFLGWGVTIQLSGIGAHGFRFAAANSTNNYIKFYGFKILGSAVVSDNHEGFGTIVGAGPNCSGTNIRFVDCTVENCVRGFHIESSVANWRDVGFIGCRIVNIVGTATGQGYGILVASILGVYTIGCYFDLCQRHSYYDANSQDSLILGNTFRRHRNGVSTGAVVSALAITRRPNAKIIGNSFDACEDCALSIEPDESDVNSPQYNVIIEGNNFHESVHWDIVIGSSAAATSGLSSNITVATNVIERTEAATAGIESVRIFNGKGITISHNTWRMWNAYTVQKSCIVIGTAAIADSFLDDILLDDNKFDIKMNGPAAYFAEITAPACGGVSLLAFRGNRLQLNAASGGLVVYDAAPTNVNIRIAQDNFLNVAETQTVGDIDATIRPGRESQVIIWGSALTANRTVTLDTASNSFPGARFRVVRTGLGVFTLNVGPGLKTIPNSTAAFVDVEFTNGAWILTGYGTL